MTANLRFVVNDYPFQNKSLPVEEISSLFSDYMLKEFGHFVQLTTDASKNDKRVAIAAVDTKNNWQFAALCPSQNSIFTAEAMAIMLAIDIFLLRKDNFVIFTDNLPVVTCLRKVTPKSPTIISHLYHRLINACKIVDSIVILWIPGKLNRAAHYLAKKGPYCSSPYNWIAAEDIINWIHKDELLSTENSTIDGSYENFYPHSYFQDSLYGKCHFPSFSVDSQASDFVTGPERRKLLTYCLLYKLKLLMLNQEEKPANNVLLLCKNSDHIRLYLLVKLCYLQPGSKNNHLSLPPEIRKQAVRRLVYNNLHMDKFN